MKCPVCDKKAETRIYHCGRCGVYVHEVCWQEHVNAAHQD